MVPSSTKGLQSGNHNGDRILKLDCSYSRLTSKRDLGDDLRMAEILKVDGDKRVYEHSTRLLSLAKSR